MSSPPLLTLPPSSSPGKTWILLASSSQPAPFPWAAECGKRKASYQLLSFTLILWAHNLNGPSGLPRNLTARPWPIQSHSPRHPCHIFSQTCHLSQASHIFVPKWEQWQRNIAPYKSPKLLVSESVQSCLFKWISSFLSPKSNLSFSLLVLIANSFIEVESTYRRMYNS